MNHGELSACNYETRAIDDNTSNAVVSGEGVVKWCERGGCRSAIEGPINSERINTIAIVTNNPNDSEVERHAQLCT